MAMAEESTDIPMVEEKLELDILENINLHIPLTPEKMEPKGDLLRGNSTGKTDISNGRLKILPNYLSPSTGSCHDFCKYGRKYVFETKKNNPLSKRVIATPGEDLKQTANVAEREKKSPTGFKPSPDSKSRIPHSPLIIKREASSPTKNAIVSSEQVSSPGKATDVLLKHDRDLKLKAVKTKPSLLPTLGFLNKKRNSSTKVNKETAESPLQGRRSSRVSPQASSPRRGRKGGTGSLLAGQRRGGNSVTGSPLVDPRNGTNSETGSPLAGPKSGRSSEAGLGKETATSKMGEKKVSAASPVKRLENMKTRNRKNAKGVSPLKNQGNVGKTEFEDPSNQKVPEKILHVIEPKAEKKTVGTSQNSLHTTKLSPSSSSSPEARSLILTQKGNHTTQLPPYSKKSLRRAQVRVDTSQSPPPTSPRSINNNRVHSKRSSASSSSPLSSSSSPSSSVHSDDSGMITEYSATEIESPKVEFKTRFPRLGKFSSVAKDLSPCRLNVRTEKSVENNSPRRLGLKQGRGLCEADSKKRSFKRKVVTIGLTDTETELEDVVLRHRVKDKKDNQSPLSDMIDEVVLKHQDMEDSKNNQSPLSDMIEEVVLRHQDMEDGKDNQSPLSDMIEEIVLKHQDVEDNKEDQSPLSDMIEAVVLKHPDVEDNKENQSPLSDMIEEVVLEHHDEEDKKDNKSLVKNSIVGVVLKHKDVEDKKQTQSLLNNVIEEAASKLAETRKSKVKALVGAFESLLTLQETTRLATSRAH